MKLEHIFIKPKDSKVIIQYVDNVGRFGKIAYDYTDNASVEALVSDANQRIPAEEDRPDKSDIEQEIGELEYRLKQLRESIGITA